MQVNVDSIVFSPNYKFNEVDFTTAEEAAAQSGGGTTVVSGDYVKLTGDVMSGELDTPLINASTFAITNANGSNVASFFGESPYANIDCSGNSTSFNVNVYSNTNQLRKYTFAYDSLDLNLAKITNCPSIAARGFVRLRGVAENSMTFLNPIFYSSFYFNQQTPTSHVPCANRIGVGQWSIYINADSAGIVSNQNLNAIIVNCTGNFNATNNGSSCMMISEYGTRAFIPAAGGAPNLIQIFLQSARVSAITTPVDIQAQTGWIDINFTAFDPLAIVS